MKIFANYAFVVFSLISTSLFITEGNLFADSSKEGHSFNQVEKDKKKNDKYEFLYETGPFEGFVAPDFTLPDIDGKSISLSQLSGKVVFLNIWATWCGPCRTEMPSMEKLYQKFKKEDFVMLAISIDRQGKSVVIPFLEELGLTFPVLLDPDSTIQKLYKIRALPSSIIIDKMGFVDTREAGARDWFSSGIIKLFEELINEPSFDQLVTIKVKD
tara:strand:- start:1579 stop:2220 length:642 start_codon:yes stop_codon:yes gene_type:complete